MCNFSKACKYLEFLLETMPLSESVHKTSKKFKVSTQELNDYLESYLGDGFDFSRYNSVFD